MANLNDLRTISVCVVQVSARASSDRSRERLLSYTIAGEDACTTDRQARSFFLQKRGDPGDYQWDSFSS